VRLALAYGHARLVSPALTARLSPRERERLEGLAKGFEREGTTAAGVLRARSALQPG